MGDHCLSGPLHVERRLLGRVCVCESSKIARGTDPLSPEERAGGEIRLVSPRGRGRQPRDVMTKTVNCYFTNPGVPELREGRRLRQNAQHYAVDHLARGSMKNAANCVSECELQDT